jgi:hypothetical protein
MDNLFLEQGLMESNNFQLYKNELVSSVTLNAESSSVQILGSRDWMKRVAS